MARERLDRERLDRERLERERLDRERLDRARLDRERLDRERLDRERLDRARWNRKRLNSVEDDCIFLVENDWVWWKDDLVVDIEIVIIIANIKMITSLINLCKVLLLSSRDIISGSKFKWMR